MADTLPSLRVDTLVPRPVRIEHVPNSPPCVLVADCCVSVFGRYCTCKRIPKCEGSITEKDKGHFEWILGFFVQKLKDILVGLDATVMFDDQVAVKEKCQKRNSTFCPHCKVFKENSLTILLQLGGNISSTDTSPILEESYALRILPDFVVITAPNTRGLFYGTQTFLQLCGSFEPSEKVEISSLIIEDWPRFQWRGMHLDVARHFFCVEFIKKFLDLLAFHKLNIFHWHLTDDQGWRIEIKNLPNLTVCGSTRLETIQGNPKELPMKFDNTPHSGYYTQDEIRDIIMYASQRCITIVPEIDVPGHCLAAIASYPDLSCSGKALSVATHWGVFEDVLCVGKESTFEFLRTIFSEVTELFPSQYIHVGGDECPKARWKTCVNCQKLMKDKRININSLQSFFMKRLRKEILLPLGKTLIGWDEIIDGGLPPDAAVMSWRGEEGGIQASNLGHQVIMCPVHPCYLNHYQALPIERQPRALGKHPVLLQHVYEFDPTKSIKRKQFVLGGEGTLWSEYLKTEWDVEYMALPRCCALADILWSSSKKPPFEELVTRLDYHCRKRLYHLDYSFCTWQFEQ